MGWRGKSESEREREKGCVAKTHHFTLVSRAGRRGKWPHLRCEERGRGGGAALDDGLLNFGNGESLMP